MEEHHIEKAFREHAEQCKCTRFSMKRVDRLPKADSIIEKFNQPDILIEGTYTWQDRDYEFHARLFHPPFSGDVFIRAFTSVDWPVFDLKTACHLTDVMNGFGVDLVYHTELGSEGAKFHGINVAAPDSAFTAVTINAFSHWMNTKLFDLEQNHSSTTE